MIAAKVSEFQNALGEIRGAVQRHVTAEMAEQHKDDPMGTDDLKDNIPGWIIAIICAAEPGVRRTHKYEGVRTRVRNPL